MVAIAVVALAAPIAFASQADAATFTVGSTADTGGCAKPPTGTTCTLRQLVNSVPAGSTISVPAGTYTLTAGELLIDQNLTITGAGARTTTVEQNPPAGTPVARVFDIQPDPASGVAPTVTISGLEILFGKTTSGSTNGNIGGNVLNEGTLTLSEDDIVLGETTGGEGAGVANVGGTLTITHSLLEDNLSFASSGSWRYLRGHRQRRQWGDDGDGDGQQLHPRRQHRRSWSRRDRKPMHPVHEQRRNDRELHDLQQRRRHGHD